MFLLILSYFLFLFLAGFYQFKLLLSGIILLMMPVFFAQFDLINSTSFLFFFIPSLLIFSVLNIKKLRIKFITKYCYDYLHKSKTHWQSFQRIDNGWFASDFERSVFRGKPQFLNFKKIELVQYHQNKIQKSINETLIDIDNGTNISAVNKLAKIGATSLLISDDYNGQNLSACETSSILKHMSQANPVLASIIGLINLDSLTSIVYQFGSKKQKQQLLPLFSDAKMMPFLKPTSLYETLESQKSSIEGRVEKRIINDKQILGVCLSFKDVILLGTSQSNCFYLNVNIKDFNSLYGNKTHLGTAICMITKDTQNINYNKGLKAYDDYLYYYSCTGNNVFIPFDKVINEENGIGKGMEYLYKNQYFASSIWPLAISIPTTNTITLTAWYFAHLQKQNGRQLLSYRLVQSKINEQFSQCLKSHLIDNISLLNNLNPQMLKFTAILNKETYMKQTMQQLELLRGILGSNSHNIKTESKVRSFYKVAHLSTELDGMSHEINQLPLIKKAALACHPYYHKEVTALSKKTDEHIEMFDQLAFQHLGYILHNLCRIWAYSIATSMLGKLVLRKNKYRSMIKRMSSCFAFISDITLIVWTFKIKINTSFASHLGECLQHITSSLALHDYYVSNTNQEDKKLAKASLKSTLFDAQTALKNTINLAFSRFPSIFMKALTFPLGRPFHETKVFKPLHNNIEKICKMGMNLDNTYSQYSPFLNKIFRAKQKLAIAESAEIAVTNATGTPLNTDNYEVLINRCLAAGIVSVEQSEQLREAYLSILEIQLTNHFGNTYQKNNYDKNEEKKT